MRRDRRAEPLHRKHAAMVGQRMEHDRCVLACLDDLVEITDRTRPYGLGQRPVEPGRAVGRQKIPADEVGRRHVVVASDGDQRRRGPVAALTRDLPRHVLDEPGLAAPGRPLEEHRDPLVVRRVEQLNLVGGRQVERRFGGRRRAGPDAGKRCRVGLGRGLRHDRTPRSARGGSMRPGPSRSRDGSRPDS